MRIVLAVEGTRGDVHPMLALGESLLAAGCEVRVCAPPDFRGESEARGMEFRAVGIGIREYLTAQAEVLARGRLSMLVAMDRYGRQSIEAQFEALPEACLGADRILGAGVQFAARSAAELHGVPYRYVTYCPALLRSQEHAPALVPAQSLPRWANRALWGAVLTAWDLPLWRRINRHRARLSLAPVSSAYRHVLSARPLLAADAELAPLPRDCPLDVEQIPCLHPAAGPPLPAKLESFLAQGMPPVYLGFGSMTDPDPAETTRALLEAVMRCGQRALISQGWAGLGAGPLPEGVLAVGPVSHARLFPRVAAVVHHGGAGTTTTAARAGVAQIVLPHVLDQYYWARRIHVLGVGPPPIPRRRLTAERLSEALAATLDNELVRERARELGERLRAANALAADPARILDDMPSAGGGRGAS
jgi:UDP:flavonoid glycosyltransferase YjiC (YdhE family)